jgi:hypothetical protein
MKNVHILPTDKPSRLHLIEDVLTFTNKYKTSVCDSEVNIYITSEEAIKEGDWVIEFQKGDDIGEVHFINSEYVIASDIQKKIILTDNPDLIAEGVQAIDDEFLEWFVKNPSCERVEVFHQLHKDEPLYQIILPQEEPKQIKCYCGHTITCDCEPLQERLEEVKDISYWKKNCEENYITTPISVLRYISELEKQQEKSYSEEDMISFAKFFTQYTFIDNTSVGDLYALDETGNHPAYKIAELISIFKKKQNEK